MLLKLLVISAFSLVLSGCSQVVVKTVCPPIKEYSDAFQDQLGKELTAASAEAAMTVAVIDYHALRNIIRACGAN